MGVVEKAVHNAPANSLPPVVALLGNPNCGKTALFNRLTGARQKVANYAGVTIERKEGAFNSPAGPDGRKNSPSGVTNHSCNRAKPSPPGLPGSSFGPAMYPSSDIAM